MAKDKRYITVRKLIAVDQIHNFEELLDIIPKTVMVNDLGMHHQTFNKLLKNPENFTLKQAFSIAALIEVDEKIVVDLIYAQCMEKRNIKRKK